MYAYCLIALVDKDRSLFLIVEINLKICSISKLLQDSNEIQRNYSEFRWIDDVIVRGLNIVFVVKRSEKLPSIIPKVRYT